MTLKLKRREDVGMEKIKSPKFLKDFNSSQAKEEKTKARWVLLSLFGLSLGLILLASLYREIPHWWKSLNSSTTVVSQQFATPTITAAPAMEEEKKTLQTMLEPLRGTWGIYFQDLETNRYFEINGEEQFTAASLIKLPVILTLFREAEGGRIDLATVYRLREEDKRGGAGSLQYKAAGYEITYRQMAQLMGKQSDNTAFKVISQVLGEEKIQSTINDLGMKKTSFAQNLTTPKDIGIFFERLWRGRVVSDKSREEILSFLTETIWEERIPAGLPKGIRVAHKIGSEVGVVSDAGIVFDQKPFIVVIMSQGVNEIEAKKALPEISKMIYEMHEQQ